MAGAGFLLHQAVFHPHKPLHPSFWTVSGFKVSAAPLPCSDSNRPWERVEKHELLSRKYIQMAQQQGLCDMRYRLRRQTGSCTSGHCLGKDSGQPGQHPPPPGPAPQKAGAAPATDPSQQCRFAEVQMLEGGGSQCSASGAGLASCREPTWLPQGFHLDQILGADKLNTPVSDNACGPAASPEDTQETDPEGALHLLCICPPSPPPPTNCLPGPAGGRGGCQPGRLCLLRKRQDTWATAGGPV